MTALSPHDFVFVVPGEPVPKARARVSTRQVRTAKGSKTIVRMYTPAETEAYEAKVRLIAQAHRPTGWPLDCHYEVQLVVCRTTPGDWDNYSKAAVDSLNPRRAKRGKRGHPAIPGVLWADDRLVRKASVAVYDVERQPHLCFRVIAHPVYCSHCGGKTFYPVEGRCEACAGVLAAKRAKRLPRTPPRAR